MIARADQSAQRVGKFYALPNWTADGRLAALDGTAVKVLLCLARNASPSDRCQLSVGEIAAVVGAVSRNVRRAILRLEESKIVTVERSVGGNPRESGNTFRLLDWCPQRAPGATATPDDCAPGGNVTPGASVRGPLAPAPRLPLAQTSPRQEQEKNTRTSAPESAPRNGAHPPPGFDAFWGAYPRKTAKKAALKAWRGAVRDAQLERRLNQAEAEALLASVAEAFARSDKGQGEAKYIPYPATWLNEGRWADDPAEWSEAKRTNGKKVALKYV